MPEHPATSLVRVEVGTDIPLPSSALAKQVRAPSLTTLELHPTDQQRRLMSLIGGKV